MSLGSYATGQHVTRWIFPLVEYQDLSGTTRKHRAVLGGLILGVLVNFIHDLLKIVPGFLTSNP